MKIYILIFLLTLTTPLIYSNSAQEDKNKAINSDTIPKYAVGFSLFSIFRDYQIGAFYTSNIEINCEFGFIINGSWRAGIKLNHSTYTEAAKSDRDGGIYFRMTLIPFLQYYPINQLFIESGLGVGYGFISFRDNEGDLLRDWEDLFLYRHYISTGYDIPITKSKLLIIRPSVNLMQRYEKTPNYPVLPKKSKETEIGFTVSFIFQIYHKNHLL
jgi:hypothetical protein